MHKLTAALAPLLVVAALVAAPPLTQDEETLKKDLTAVIALHGLPCGEVVAVTVRAENDYFATCRDGNRYHVYLSAEGRVVVERQT